MKPPDDKKPHGNSKKSRKKQHIYEIKDSDFPDENNTFKYGVSGSELNKNGTSKRANSQVNSLNKKSGFLKFFAKLLFKNIDGREEALRKEEELVAEFVDKNKEMPRGMERPHPKTFKKRKK